MPTLNEVVEYCDARLRRAAFKDAPGAFNGLQVSNAGQVTRIGAAVDAGLVPFRMAVEAKVDFLIVHHGAYWDMPKALTGAVYDRFATLIRGGCALYSSHLPLDSHPEIGNSAVIARELSLTPDKPFFVKDGESVGWSCAFDASRNELRQRLETRYARVIPLEFGEEKPGRIAICSGSGNSAMAELLKEGIDTLVTGELREEWFNFAQEQRLNLYVCGHYSTEVHGVKALAAELSARYGIPWEFIPTGNPL